MSRTLILILWGGRMFLEAAEIVVRGRRSLDQSLGDSPWRRPPWSGGGNFWQGRG